MMPFEPPKAPKITWASSLDQREGHKKYSAEVSVAINPRFSTTIDIPSKKETRTGDLYFSVAVLWLLSNCG
ncbi:MAG: hypothetical protein IMZ47_02890 [Firmicutes bacterium]|nr:hypothetical protein [Bacillota bacterium]